MNYLKLLLLLSILTSCSNMTSKKEKTMDKETKPIPNKIIIAHRGTTYWAPEETEPAYRWARNIGADYLELDLQLTKDNYLVAFHDNDLKRTTNISAVFPKRKEQSIHDFTLKELRSLDVGTWFNNKYPERAKEKYLGLTILTLEDIIKIAEGFQIKKRENKPVERLEKGVWNGHFQYEKDPFDNGNRPGVYIETKHPKLQVEKLLADELTRLGWNRNTQLKEITTQDNKTKVASTKQRVILQSFSPKSIENLQKYLPNIPKCFLLWKADMKDEIEENYQKAIQFALKNNVQYIGPSIAGAPNNYDELTATWMTDLIHQSNLKVHAYTFDTTQQLNDYNDRVEAVFTNRTDLALEFYKRENKPSPKQVLKHLGY